MKQTTKKKQTWTPAKRAAFAAKMKAAREAAAKKRAGTPPEGVPAHMKARHIATMARAKRTTEHRASAAKSSSNPPSVNGEGMTFAEWKAAAGPKAPKGLDAVKAWKAGEDPTEYRAPAAKKNAPRFTSGPSVDNYIDDLMEDADRKLQDELDQIATSDKPPSRRAAMRDAAYARHARAYKKIDREADKRAKRNPPAARRNAPDRVRKLAMEWDDQDRSNPGWAWFASYESGHRLSGGLDGRVSASLATMRRRFARELGRDFPAAARNDDAWSLDGSRAWVWEA